MANYYGYTAGGSSQSYSRVTNPSSYGNSSYGATQTPQPSTYIAQTQQVQQPQTAYVAYGHQSSGSANSSQSYQPSYNSYSSTTPQPSPRYNTNASQNQHFYQQPSASSSARNGSSSYFSTTPSQVKTELRPSQSQMYASSGSSNYTQQHVPEVKYTKHEVAIPVTTRVQATNQISYIAPKPVSATVISSEPAAAKPTSDYARQQNISNYEKALISAATSIYQNQRKGGGGASVSSQPSYNTKNLPYWKQKRLQAQQNRDPNKPIIASEVKAYLYAWLGKERTRPEYNITAHGSSQFRQTYVCEVVSPGFKYVAKGAAGNKKDAQTRAAWDFVDFLVREGRMKEEELPTRENKFKASNNKLPPGYKEKDEKQVTEVIAKKKLATKNIQFVGGSTLQLSAEKPAESSTAISYPPATSSQETSTEPKSQTITVDVAPSATTVVRVKQNTSVAAPQALSANDVDVSASKNSPIGESYVEQVWTDGRVIRYRCKLCECEFNDPSGRELHVRGRRHRLSYKKKVDPSIEVDVKLNPKQKSMMLMKMRQEARRDAMRQQQREIEMWNEQMLKEEEAEMRAYEEELWFQYQRELLHYEEEIERHRRMKIPPPLHIVPPLPPVLQCYQPRMPNQQMKTLDDQHVVAKHAMIYPIEEELNAVQEAVQDVEGALKEVSTSIHEQELKVHAASINANFGSKKPPPQRLLKAVLRIGSLAKGLLLRGNLSVQLVLMCEEKPTAGMLTRVADNLLTQLEKQKEAKFTVVKCVEDCAINLATVSPPIVNIQVTLTATLMRPKVDASVDGASAQGASKPDPPDILDRQKCCLALAALRHSKWYQAKATGLQSCVIVTRVMKDLCVRVPTWAPMSEWAIELLVEKSIASAKLPLSPSTALRRVFEVIASGALLPRGGGLIDPCERTPTDAAASLTDQQREDITASAQHALRMVAFRSIHKVLGIEQLSPETCGGRKRAGSDAVESKNKVAKTSEVANLIQKVKKELGK